MLELTSCEYGHDNMIWSYLHGWTAALLLKNIFIPWLKHLRSQLRWWNSALNNELSLKNVYWDCRWSHPWTCDTWRI